MKRIHVKRASLPLLPLVGLAAALVVFLSYGYGTAPKVQATDPNLEFNMAVTSGGTGTCDTTGIDPHVKGAAVCNVAVGTAFTVEVHLTSPGAQSGNVGGVQTVIGWTAGLIGPGDPSSIKAVTAVNCPGFGATSAPFVAVPHSAAAACAVGVGAPGGILTDAQATGFIGRFVLNCTAAPSQQSVTMLVTAPLDNGGTIVADPSFPFASHAEKDGSEVLTIACATPTPGPVGGISLDPQLPGSSGGAASALLAIVGATAGAIALGGAGWYARRRRVQ